MDNIFLIKQLDTLIHAYDAMKTQSRFKDLSDLPKAERQGLITRAISAVQRISGVKSVYSKEIERLIIQDKELYVYTSGVLGVVKGLRDDIEDGYLNSLIELIHAEVFSDFLDASNHLNESGFKDAAAVLAGSTLENHLKKLAIKNEIEVVKDDGRNITADKLNADLVKSNVYSGLDQKNVTAWLGLRNNAAHGNYNAYSQEQVRLFISSIQDFITRTPA